MAMYTCEKCGASQDHNKFGICASCGAMALDETGG
jgi:ribosomal protein L37E